jgi:predicted phosphodiesterase
LGDVTHNALVSNELSFYQQNETAFSIAAGLFQGFGIPVYPVWGNHDYGVECGGADGDVPRELAHQVFEELLGAPPYQSVEVGGFEFVLTNGQLGDTWDSASPLCNTSLASYGQEQLEWVASRLDLGKPTFVLSHYMRILHHDEEPGAFDSLPTLLDSYPNVSGFLVGHTHRWLDLTPLNFDVWHQVVAATRYDSDNFVVIDLDPATGTFELPDQGKQIPSSSCANTWSYDGEPAPVPNAPETGECVIGVED